MASIPSIWPRPNHPALASAYPVALWSLLQSPSSSLCILYALFVRVFNCSFPFELFPCFLFKKKEEINSEGRGPDFYITLVYICVHFLVHVPSLLESSFCAFGVHFCLSCTCVHAHAQSDSCGPPIPTLFMVRQFRAKSLLRGPSRWVWVA